VWVRDGGRLRHLGNAVAGTYDSVARRQFFSLQVASLSDGTYNVVVYAVPAGSRRALPGVERTITVATSGPGVVTFVDSPGRGATITPPFLIEGWALDTTAARGSGIAGVEVWDGPIDGGRKLGDAAYGYFRPDLGERIGDTRFNSAGFNFLVDSLDSGDHALHLYARLPSGAYAQPHILAIRIAERPAGPDNPEIEPLLSNVPFPAALALAPDGRLFFGELWEGNIRTLDTHASETAPRAFVHLDVATTGEVGLLSIALHPQFATNGYVYVLYSVPDDEGRALEHRVVRYRDADGAGVDETTIIAGLPASATGFHNGGAMAFGPDGNLYLSIGDNEQAERAADRTSLLGKILRYTDSGGIPADNPIPGSPVYALGFRNVFGLAFQPFTGRLWATENGVDANDELNIITADGDYGWPRVRGVADTTPYIDPVLTLTPSVAPTGLAFASPSALYFCDVVTATLHRVQITGDLLDTVGEHELVGRGCGVGIVAAMDGTLYFSDNAAIYRYRAGGP
jgi:glucose/arabinose dehydrogenase